MRFSRKSWFIAILCLAFGAASEAEAQSAAPAEARVVAKVEWAGEKPSKVQFQSRLGNTDFRDRQSHYLGEQTFENSLFERLSLIVRYDDGTSVPFPVRGTVGSRPFSFTVNKPSTAVVCNYDVADRMERAAKSADHDELIATMQKARMLLEKEADGCSVYLTRRVTKIYFDASCNLAKRTEFFDLSGDAVERLLAAYDRDKKLPKIKGEIKSCQGNVRGESIKTVASTMRKAVNAGNIARFEDLDARLGQVLSQEEWSAAAERVGLGDRHFELLRMEAASTPEWRDATAASSTPVDIESARAENVEGPGASPPDD